MYGMRDNSPSGSVEGYFLADNTYMQNLEAHPCICAYIICPAVHKLVIANYRREATNVIILYNCSIII
jgi:hypothetical protein